jgi:hypothetical protein
MAPAVAVKGEARLIRRNKVASPVNASLKISLTETYPLLKVLLGENGSAKRKSNTVVF